MGNIKHDPHARQKERNKAKLIPKEKRQLRLVLPAPNKNNNVLETCKRWSSTAVKKFKAQQRENAERLKQQLCDQAHRDKMRKQGVQPQTSCPSRFSKTGMVTNRPGIQSLIRK